jgi:hypothetical protein
MVGHNNHLSGPEHQESETDLVEQFVVSAIVLITLADPITMVIKSYLVEEVILPVISLVMLVENEKAIILVIKGFPKPMQGDTKE